MLTSNKLLPKNHFEKKTVLILGGIVNSYESVK